MPTPRVVRMTLRRLPLGLFLLSATSGALLISDLDRRQASERAMPNAAVLRYASSQPMEEGTPGALEAVRKAGFRDAEDLAGRRRLFFLGPPRLRQLATKAREL